MSANWLLTETHFDPARLQARETLFTIGNGVLCTRGTFEERYPGDTPVSLAHGLYDDVPVYISELANLPNWTVLQLWVGGEPFRLDLGTLLDYERTLDLGTGCLIRKVVWRSPAGRTLALSWERWISLADRQAMGVRLSLHSVDFSGEVTIHASLDGLVDNAGIRHWEYVGQGAVAQSAVGQEALGEAGSYLHLRTKGTGLEICQAFALHLDAGEVLGIDRQDAPWAPGVRLTTRLQPGQTCAVEKLVCLLTGFDGEAPAASPPGGPEPASTWEAPAGRLPAAAAEKLRELSRTGYAALREANARAWSREWDDCGVTIEGAPADELAVRYSLFQLLIAAPRHPIPSSIGARGLSGFAYRGHVFWDAETYMLPFFLFTRPELARQMLLYRYRMLAGARENARQKGMSGSMFPLESADSGVETTPRWVPSPNRMELERIWCGDLEQLITATIAVTAHRYWQVTGDEAFLIEAGAEIILDGACFWEGRVEWNPAVGSYEINDVQGPDEYHLHVNNNAFTNQLVRRHFEIAEEVWTTLQDHAPEKAAELEMRLQLTPARRHLWHTIAGHMPLPLDPQTGLIPQFDGFFHLDELDLAQYEPRLQSMQVIMGVPGTQKAQVVRQPDVLMLPFLFPDLVDPATLRKNWAYYTPRTDLTHGSSLGYSVQATLAARLGEVERAYADFRAACAIDLTDSFDETAEGIHLGNAGGIWQAVVFGFAGLELETGSGQAAPGFRLNPHLPRTWKRLAFCFTLHGERHTVDLANPAARSSTPGESRPEMSSIQAPGAAPGPVLDSGFGFPESPREVKTLLDNLPGMSYLGRNDPHRTLLSVDRYAFPLTGFHPAALVQNRAIQYTELIHPDDRLYVQAAIQEAIRASQPFRLLYRVVTADKGEKWVWECGRGVTGNIPVGNDLAGGTPAGATPGEVLLQGRVIELSGRNPEYDALFEYAEMLESLREIDQAILAADSSTEVIHIALRTLGRLLPGFQLHLALLNRPLDQVEVFSLADPAREIAWEARPITPEISRFWTASRDTSGRDTPGQTSGAASSHGDPAQEADGWMEAYARHLLGGGGTAHQAPLLLKSLRLQPLRSHGDLVGLLSLGSETAAALDPDQFSMVQEVTRSLVIAIEQRRLLEQVRFTNLRLENLSRHLVDVQEKERRYLARELHDEIGQALTAIKLNLESLAGHTMPDAPRRLVDSIQIVNQTLQQVRNLSLDLRPALLDELGLTATLRWYVDRVAQWNNLTAQFHAHLQEERLPPEMETTLFRVAQEALTNIIRYAGASRIEVQLAQTGERVSLHVRDNGCGFSVEEAFQAAARGASLGLLSMQERMHLTGGQLKIHSNPGSGTEVVAEIPYPAGSDRTA